MRFRGLKPTSVATLVLFCAQPTLAVDSSNPPFTLLSKAEEPLRVSEYMFRTDNSDPLIPVRVLGGVLKPGLYHVPAKTGLITLIALSGGTASDAKLSEVLLTRGQEDSANRSQVVNFEKAIETNQQIDLKAGDTVFVKHDRPWFGQNVTVAVTLVTSIVGVVMSALIIRNELRR